MVKIAKNNDLDNQIVMISVKEYKYLLSCKKAVENLHKINKTLKTKLKKELAKKC